MRERLLSAALDLFAANGFAETTIDQIAERADVARQTVALPQLGQTRAGA